ncbi:hypothetical protein B6G00_10030 [Salinivibrio sp. YCSC6]|nr:hypothetical protein B6G00_10030 [Salinivibrio sp. YCSC6]
MVNIWSKTRFCPKLIWKTQLHKMLFSNEKMFGFSQQLTVKHLLKSKIITLLLCDYLLYVIEIRNMEAIRAFRL